MILKKTINFKKFLKDDEFTLRAERFLTSIGSGDDIFEYLRDSNFSPSAALLRASQAKDWSQQNKEDYNYLRNKFDNASVGGAFQVAKLLKDSFIDVLTDPINILALPIIIGTGGVGGWNDRRSNGWSFNWFR